MSLQGQIPDEGALRNKVNTAIEATLPKITAETKSILENLSYNRKRFIWCLLILLAFIFVVLKFNVISWQLATVPMIVMLIVIHRYGSSWFKSQAALTLKLNSILTSLLTDVLDQTFTWQKSEIHEEETKRLFHESGLMIESIDLVKADDLYACQTPYPISFRELFAVRKERNGNHTNTVILFQGLFIILTLPKTLQAETFISTEGDSSGFAHSSFWGRVIGQSKIEETKMEWNDFEKSLHVASSDGAEARYILTTDFMEALYNWWQVGKENIRIKFSDNRMQMLLPDGRIKIDFSIDNIEEKALQEYFYSMVKPLWRVLLLAEKIKL